METSIREKEGGFTLIELMIIVAVVAILSLLMLPKMNHLLAKAHETGNNRMAVSKSYLKILLRT